MRKLLPIFVIIIILATGAAYYSVWNKKADALNAKVESFIAGVNKNKQYITHEGISTGGFPNDIHISIKNITVNLPMSELLSA